MVRKLLAAAGLALVMIVATTGCNGDDDGDLAAWCGLMAAIDERDGFPTDAEIDTLVDTAPSAIDDDVEAAAKILRKDGEEAVGSPELDPHLDAVFAFQDEECPGQ